jgi:hypothetical protein
MDVKGEGPRLMRKVAIKKKGRAQRAHPFLVYDVL